VLTQIYEVSDPAEATAISTIGIDHVGVLVGDGEFPRELTIEAAERVATAILPPSKFSALFLTHKISLIETMGPQIASPHRPSRGSA
jgi:phosphoribosylanthranilate isomerase